MLLNVGENGDEREREKENREGKNLGF